jgi:predicted ATPase
MDPLLARALRNAFVHRTIEPEVLQSTILERLQSPGRRLLVPGASEVPEVFDFGNEFLTLLRDRILYLGPLRQDPQLVYKALPSVGTGNLGAKGELTASVFHAFSDQTVVCPLEDGTRANKPLGAALNYWIERLELAEEIQTRDWGPLGLGLEVRRPGITRPLDLTNVGVGVSQLIPVLVMCLLAPLGSVLLLEQPELHLHPATQQKLGDFFLSVARSGRQLIIETHSEHLVNRLRRKIAEDETDRVLREVRFIFAELTEKGTKFEAVTPNRLGALEKWPAGFFDQGPREAAVILRAGLQKKKNQSPAF